MMADAEQKQRSFKSEVGRMILIGAIVYCGLLTLWLGITTFFRCEISQPVRDITIIILTWFTTKAGTVVDHQFGSSQSSEDKSRFIEGTKPPEPPKGDRNA